MSLAPRFVILLIIGILISALGGLSSSVGRCDPAAYRDRIDGPGVRLVPKVPPRPVATPIGGQRSDPVLLQSLADAVRSDVMLAHLDYLSTDLMTRYYNTAGMVAATQYVHDEFVAYGLDEVWFDDFDISGNPVRNVIGVKTGTVDPDRIVMVCGHLDSTSPENQTLAPGAEDNGSGSAGVLEAARLLAPLETDASIYFVCFTAEEIGLIGSEHLAAIADAENWNLQAVLNMDMVGYDRPGAPDLWIEGFYGNPGSVALMDLLEQTANAVTDMAVYRYPDDGWGSDHVPFNSYGYASLLAIDYDWNNYSCYHRTCDVVENLVPDHFREMVAAVTATGADLAGLVGTAGRVEGIADRTDSEDDAGILIEVVGSGYAPATSGDGGTFLLPELLPGTYLLEASAAGYGSVEIEVTILPGQPTETTIPLDPVVAAIIQGTVGLEGGGPAAGARLLVSGQETGALADDNGDYVLDPVYPGEVVVTALHADRMPGIAVLEVPGGAEITGIDFTLVPVWDFEETDDGLIGEGGWERGSDGVAGSHSGTNVWGVRLGGNYVNCTDARLDLPPLDLRGFEEVTLRFWHWYETEAEYDGGNIQISVDGGATWKVLIPAGGYPDAMSGSCNVLDGQVGFCGNGTVWSQAEIDLTPYTQYSDGTVFVRFWFASDGGVRERGWYLDDLVIDGTLVPADVAEGLPEGERILSGLRVTPNPAAGRTTVRFHLASAVPVLAGVYDAQGRRVRSLAHQQILDAGERSLFFDGADDAGRDVPTGVYWVRVIAGGRDRSERIVWIR